MTDLPYQGQRAALLTRHGKESVIGPILREALGIELIQTAAFDTDRLGTFSGELERTLSPTDCARRKAMLAIACTGLDIGLGSEGSFGPGPLGPVITWNTELVAWHDRQRDWTVIGRARGPCSARRATAVDQAAALTFVDAAPPGQGLLVSCGTHYHKALYGPEAVMAAVAACHATAGQESVTIEFDLRAQHSPERRERIAAATRDLVERLCSRCPRCARPDFSPDQTINGLPCADCGEPTGLALERLAACSGCGHEARVRTAAAYADPQYCDRCNP